jgi:hypothetical protein
MLASKGVAGRLRTLSPVTLHRRAGRRVAVRAAALGALLLVPTGFLILALGRAAGDGPAPAILAAPYVSSFGIRRDVNGDLDCPPSEGGANVTDTQIDIGTSQIYCIYADITDPDGWSSVNYVNVSSYYDGGSEATTYNQTVGANRNFLLNYTNISSSSFAMRWPTTSEMTFLGGVDQTISGTNHELRWRLRFGNSVRWAPCTFAGPDHCGLQPITSVNSWNATLRIVDSTSNVVRPPASNTRMEWGVYKLTTLAVTGSPAGSGYPGGPEFFLAQGNPQSVSFSSNAPYRLNLSICDLTTNGICGAATSVIPRESIRIEGDPAKLNQPFRVAFPPTTGDLVLNGTAACYNEFRNGTGTSGATVAWYAQIPPATLAGTYSSVITYTLWATQVANICTQMTPDPPHFLYTPLVTDLTATSFRVSWVANRPVAGILELSTSSTFASVLCTATDGSPNLASGAALISTSGPCVLTPGSTYYWRVRMVDSQSRVAFYPTQTTYPSVKMKISTATQTGNPAYIIGPYRDIDGGESCNATDDRQQFFLVYLNHSGAGTLAGRGAGSNSGCGQGAKAGWLINIASNNLRDDNDAGAPHALACGESVSLWTVGFNDSLLHENRTTNTLPSGGCPPLPGTVSIAVKTRPNASTNFPQFLTTPLVTDLTSTSLRLSWVPNKPIHATLHLSLASDFSSFYCTQMDTLNLLTSGGSLIETTSPYCTLNPGTTYYWRAHAMDSQGRVTYYPSSGAYSSNTTKTNFDPGDANNPTLLAGPYRDVDGSTTCNTPDDRQQHFLVYVNHSGAERLGWRSTSAGNSGCGQGSKANWLVTMPLSNLRNNDAAGGPHTCAAGDGTNPTRLWVTGFNNTRLHSNNSVTFTYPCPGGTISRTVRTTVDQTGAPSFQYTPIPSDLTFAAFAVSWVASAPVVGSVSLSTSSTFASILCTATDSSTFLISAAVLVPTAPACSLSSGTTYYWRAHIMDSVGRTARYPSAGPYPSNTTKTNADPGAGTNPTVALGPYRDPNSNNACDQVDERQPYFLVYLNHTGAETLASRGAGSNVGCGSGALAGWIISFATDNLRDSTAAGGPHTLGAAESFSTTLRGLHLGVYRTGSVSVTWDGAEDPIVRIVESAPTLLIAGPGTPSGATTGAVDRPTAVAQASPRHGGVPDTSFKGFRTRR